MSRRFRRTDLNPRNGLGGVMRKLQVLLIFLSCFGAGGASADDAGRTVALLLAVPEVTSLAELAGKNIAIDEAAAAANDEARRKVEAAVNAKLAEGQAKALHWLVNGEVRAAVLTLDYPETAEWSAEIAGFKVFRIPLTDRPQVAEVAPAAPAAPDSQPAGTPLSPALLEARAEAVDPASVAAAKKVRDQMRVATVIAEHVMTLRDAEKKALSSPDGGDRRSRLSWPGPRSSRYPNLPGRSSRSTTSI